MNVSDLPIAAMAEPPEINWQFQDLHMATPSRDWVALQKLEAQICLFYHQQAHYSYVMGDLYYGAIYSLPYWEMLSLEGLDEERLEFVQSGCLMIIVAMCWEILDTTGCFLSSHVPAALAQVRACQPATGRVARLRQHVQDVLTHIHEKRQGSGGFEAESLWAHQEFVLGYFRRWCDEFAKNPYYGGVA